MSSKPNTWRPLHIVHLEDSEPDAYLIKTIITLEWPMAKIERVETYQDFTQALKRPGVDLVLADYSLPAFDGLAALDIARMTAPGVPFIFLSGTIAENVAAEALNNGAADYILKDRMGRLCPAIHRVLEEAEDHPVAREVSKPRKGFRLLHVEDSANDAELTAKALSREWPDVDIERVQTRESFVASLQRPDLDLILSDYSMPGFDGKSALALARSLRPEVPFIFLSGSIGEENAIEALKLGATDYILKDRAGRLRPAIRRALADSAEEPAAPPPHKPTDGRDPIVERLQVLAAANTLVVWDWDLVTGDNWWSEGLVGALGYARGEMGPEFPMLPNEAHPHDAVRVRDSLRSALQGGQRWNEEFRFRHRDGHYVRVRADAAIVREEDEWPVRMVGALLVVGEERASEATITPDSQAKKIETLVSSTAHVLSNILTPILMGAGLLRLKSTEEERVKLLDLIESSGKRGSKIAETLLASGIGNESPRGPLQLRDLVGEAAENLRDTLPPSVTLEVRVDADAHDVMGERAQLSRVLAILGSNARDAMPNGGTLSIVVQNAEVDGAMAKANPGSRPGSYALITVKDTGPGLSPEIEERLFEAFVTTKKPSDGTGLGLFLAMYIVREHGGFITAASQPKKGALFRVFIPAYSDTDRRA